MSILRHYYLLFLFVLGCAPYKKYDLNDVRERWEKDIKHFDKLSAAGYPDDPILFYGSSSIRLWESIEEDLEPMNVVRRGYGGASLHDAAYYARRVLRPVDYRALVLFVANDIWGHQYDKSPAEMRKLIDYIVKTSRRHRSKSPVFLIEVTHSPSRNHLIEEWDAANAMLREYAEKENGVYFIPTRDIFIQPDGKSNPDLFREDNIHLNKLGYQRWSKRIKSQLEDLLEPQRNPE